MVLGDGKSVIGVVGAGSWGITGVSCTGATGVVGSGSGVSTFGVGST
jgi:hypothetical protein